VTTCLRMQRNVLIGLGCCYVGEQPSTDFRSADGTKRLLMCCFCERMLEDSIRFVWDDAWAVIEREMIEMAPRLTLVKL